MRHTRHACHGHRGPKTTQGAFFCTMHSMTRQANVFASRRLNSAPARTDQSLTGRLRLAGSSRRRRPHQLGKHGRAGPVRAARVWAGAGRMGGIFRLAEARHRPVGRRSSRRLRLPSDLPEWRPEARRSLATPRRAGLGGSARGPGARGAGLQTRAPLPTVTRAGMARVPRPAPRERLGTAAGLVTRVVPAARPRARGAFARRSRERAVTSLSRVNFQARFSPPCPGWRAGQRPGSRWDLLCDPSRLNTEKRHEFGREPPSQRSPLKGLGVVAGAGAMEGC
jgi:hypothetical protein